MSSNSNSRRPAAPSPSPKQTISKQPKPVVKIYVDGAAMPNPGHGGAGIVILTEINGKRHKKAFGIYLGDGITNNVAEIRAVIHALNALKRPCSVEVFSDSQLVVKTMRGEFRRHLNRDVWAEADAAASRHEVTWTWVRGHIGDEFNEAAHQLADSAALQQSNVD